MVGARGTFSLDLTAGAYPFAAMNFIGMIPTASPFSTAVPGASTLTAWKEPAECSNANTVITLDGFACAVRSFNLDMGVQVNLRHLIGARYINRGNHAISGRMVIEAPSMAAKDYLATLRSGALVPIAITHGTTAATSSKSPRPVCKLPTATRRRRMAN